MDCLRRLDPVEFAASDGTFLTGTPDQCVDHLVRYWRLGVRDFIVDVDEFTDDEQVGVFAENVAPLARARLAAAV